MISQTTDLLIALFSARAQRGKRSGIRRGYVDRAGQMFLCGDVRIHQAIAGEQRQKRRWRSPPCRSSRPVTL